MTDQKTLVPASDEAEVSESLTPEMLGIEGVTSAAPTPATGVTPGQETEDAAELRAKLEQVTSELDAFKNRANDDMNALRSSLDRSRSAALAEKDREVDEATARMHAAVKANLDEQQALEYDLTIKSQQVDMYRDRYENLQAELDAKANMDSWTRGFMQMGVPYTDLDHSSPEALITSGYASIEAGRQSNLAKITELENTIRQLQAHKEAGTTPAPTTPAPTPRAPVEAPPTLGTQAGTTPSATKTIGQLLTSLEAQLGYKVTEDEMWNMVNNGQIPMDVLSGLIIP